MQNAHERFGTLEFTKRTQDTTTRVRVYIDRAVLEPVKEEKGVQGVSLCRHFSCSRNQPFMQQIK